MKISGFQKLTLLDFPEKVACTVFTAGCQLRCPFCHNASLVTHIDPAASIPANEILSYLQKRQGILEGVCVTGGEPLLQADLEVFLRQVKALGLAVKLDTNGADPARLKALVQEGLVDYVAMDIKNSRENYAKTVGVNHFDIAPIAESVRFLLGGDVEFEFRTTVTAELHTVFDIEAIARWIAGAKRYFLQNFVDSGDLIGDQLSPVPAEELLKMRDTAAYLVPGTRIRGQETHNIL